MASFFTRTHAFLFPVILVISALQVEQADAQIWNEIRILHVDTDQFPRIRVRVRAFCNGVQTDQIDQLSIVIDEDGQQHSATLWCPNTSVPVSVALALDRSGSVGGTTIYRIKEGARQFIELMRNHPTGDDECAILSFNDYVSLDQEMTTSFNALDAAIDNIWPAGVTSLYDAVIEALMEVDKNASNGIRAVVVFSDGADNNSAATREDAITLARQLNIPVYAMAVSYIKNSPELSNMKMLADSTGGQYIVIDHPDDIVPAFNAMMSLVSGGANDCVMEYYSDCPDGSERDITVIASACGLADTARVKYTAPLDPALPAISVEFDSSAAYSGGDLLLPVIINGSGVVDELRFKALERSPLRFREAITAGYLADLMQVNASVVWDSLIVELRGPIALNGHDTLLVLRYETENIQRDSTFLYPLFFVDKKSTDCRQLKVENTLFSIMKRPQLDVACTDSVTIEWDDLNGTFVVNEFTINTTIHNSGLGPAKNTKVVLHYPDELELVAPASDTIWVADDTLKQGEFEFAGFRLRVRPDDSTKVFDVCIEVLPDSGVATLCCTRVTVERAKPLLTMHCDMPNRIEWVDSLNAYRPDIFPVTVRLFNRSELDVENIEAWIHVPQGFVVDSTTPVNTFITPNRISRLDTGTVTWYVRPLERPNDELLRFCIKAAVGPDTVECCSDIFIQASPVRVSMLCTDTQLLVYDDDQRVYDPERFFVQTTVRNVSTLTMATARAHITLPPFISLAGGEYPSKDFPGGAVIQPGDSATVKWLVVADGTPSAPSSICVRVSGENFPGSQCCTQLDVETVNAVPTLSCTLAAPDSIHYRESGYDPDPFLLTVDIANQGDSPARDVYAALLQGEDLSIDQGDAALKLVTDSLGGGDFTSTSFRIRVLDRTVSRYDTIRVSVYAANGGAYLCAIPVWIEAVRAPEFVLACNGPDTLVFVDSLNTYAPSPFRVSVTARNVGTSAADSVVAEVLPAPNIELVAGERAAKMLTPSRLEIGKDGDASWLVNAVPRQASRMDTIHVQVRGRGRTLTQTAPCPVVLYIPAVRSAELDLVCTLPDSLEYDSLKGALKPDPFVAQMTVKNSGDAIAYDVQAHVVLPPEVRLAPGEVDVRTIGTLAPGEETVLFWQLRAIAGEDPSIVDVCFEVSRRFAPAERCCRSLRIPGKVHTPGSIALDCGLVDSVRVDEATGAYPEIEMSATVRNTSQVTVDLVRLTIQTSGSILLQAGEPQTRELRTLLPGKQGIVTWKLRVLRDTSTVLKDYDIGVTAFSGDVSVPCAATVVVIPPPVIPKDFSIECSTRDTIRFDGNVWTPPSFSVNARIINTGSTTLSAPRGTITLSGDILLDAGEPATKMLGVDLAPGETGVLSWRVLPQPGLDEGNHPFHLSITAEDVQARECEPVVYAFHDIVSDTSAVILQCGTPDTIRWDAAQGQYAPSPFPVTVTVRAVGTQRNLRALILPGNGIALAAGEANEKVFAGELADGESTVFTWYCEAVNSNEPRDTDVCFQVQSENDMKSCCSPIHVEAVRYVVSLLMPTDVIGMAGRTVRVPVFIENPAATSIGGFSVDIGFEADVLEFSRIVRKGSLSEGWPTLDVDASVPGRLSVSAQPNGYFTFSGTLFYVEWRVISGDGTANSLAVRVTPLTFDRPAFGSGIEVLWSDGAVTTSGDCLYALATSEAVALAQNRPNPFNPSTTISFHVAADAAGDDVLLEVLDLYGRRVRLLHEGPAEEGEHSVHFDARGLPSGVYLYRVQAGGATRVRKMVLAR